MRSIMTRAIMPAPFALALVTVATGGTWVLHAAGISTAPHSVRVGSSFDAEVQAWFESRGYAAAAPKVQARNGGLFVRAGATIEPGEAIASIQPSLIILPSTLVGFSQMPSALQIWLCFERHQPNSQFGPYLRSLPNSFDLPLMWPAADREALRPGWLVAGVAADVAMVQKTHEQQMMPFCARIPPETPGADDICSLETWRWAWAIVWSRALGIPRDAEAAATAGQKLPPPRLPGSGRASAGLIPLLDMANHQRDAKVRSAWDASTGLLRVTSTVSLKGGDEVFINYNKLWSSAEFLQHYGMIPALAEAQAPEVSTGSLQMVNGLEAEVVGLPASPVLLPEEATEPAKCLLALLLRSQLGPAMLFDDPGQGHVWCGVAVPEQIRIPSPSSEDGSAGTLRILLLVGAAQTLPQSEIVALVEEALVTEEGAGEMVASRLKARLGRGRGGAARVGALRAVVSILQRWEAWYHSPGRAWNATHCSYTYLLAGPSRGDCDIYGNVQ